MNTDKIIKDLLDKFSDDSCTCGKYDFVKQMPYINACPIHEPDLYKKQKQEMKKFTEHMKDNTSVERYYNNTDKQPQTVYVHDPLGRYFLDKDSLYEKENTERIEPIENVYIFTPAELEAMKAEWQRELIDVLGKLLSGDSGCPMCDSGVLRTEGKDHWDDCVWANAQKIYDNLKSKP